MTKETNRDMAEARSILDTLTLHDYSIDGILAFVSMFTGYGLDVTDYNELGEELRLYGFHYQELDDLREVTP